MNLFTMIPAPWPLEPDEGGASLVLCDANVDNAVGSNWSAARNKTGIFINGKDCCSPGLANTISCSSVPSVFVDVMDFFFLPKTFTIDVGTTVRWTNKGGTHNINGNQSVYPSILLLLVMDHLHQHCGRMILHSPRLAYTSINVTTCFFRV